ncbi:MAG: TetR/AcrR family transcriptional regulator, partial [Pseudomonadota bacterium]|nr:TetR/AcrR family transcriptional regulator [Pseudomonadota bacterium]
MDKRELIITATCDLIAENGLQATPISMVAKEACCGAGTIYRYFETKEELIEDVYLTLMERFSDACLKDVDENASVREQLNSVWLNLY